MNSTTSQLQQSFVTKPTFCWPDVQGQLPPVCVPASVPALSSAPAPSPVCAAASAPANSSVCVSSFASVNSSALHPIGPFVTPPQTTSLIGGVSPFYKNPSTSSSSSTMLIPEFYKQNVTTSSHLNATSIIGHPNTSVAAPLASLVPPSPAFLTPPTVNSFRPSHSAAVRFPFSAGVGPMMSNFEVLGAERPLIPQSVRINPNFALCSSVSIGGYANGSLPHSGVASVSTSVAGNGLHQFAIPHISQQPLEQPEQRVHFPLGQTTVSACGNAGGQKQTQHLFDFSNGITSAMPSSMDNTSVGSVAVPISEGSNCVNQLKTLAICDSSVASQLKLAEPVDIVKIPKETNTLQLERSCTSSSSAGSAAEHRRSQPPQQMNCQVCYLAASNGLHFGARTCAACAAFFRRSISDQKRYICKRSQRCVIRAMETQGYRKMCRNCRMKRCLEIGMLPENVQNKRNKRDFYFADALSNAISQQQRQQRTNQQQMIHREGAQNEGMSPNEEGRQGKALQTEHHVVQIAKQPSTATLTNFRTGTSNQPIFGDISQQQNSREYHQMTMGIANNNTKTTTGEQQQRPRKVFTQTDEQPKLNRAPTWATTITLREI